MLWIDDKVEVTEVDQNLFLAKVKMSEAPFYSPHMDPIAIPEGYGEGGVEVCNLTKEGFKLKILPDARPVTKSND